MSLREPRHLGERKKELTQHQLDLLKMLSEGIKDRDIAEKTNLGLGTVKTHMGNIYRFLGFNQNGHSPRILAARWYWENIECR